MPYKDAALKTAEEIQQKYKVTALTVNCDPVSYTHLVKEIAFHLYTFMNTIHL